MDKIDDARGMSTEFDELDRSDRNDTARDSELIEAVNHSSSTARNGWLFFLALLSYMLVTVSSVSHKELLTDAPIKLPLLNVELSLSRFFWFAPIGVLLVHLGILLQHAALADKVRALRSVWLRAEPQLNSSQHARFRLSTYFFTQVLAGSVESVPRRVLLRLMLWGTLGLVPVIVLLLFQATYLPYHDASATTLHQVYVFIDVLLLFFLLAMTRVPREPPGISFISTRAVVFVGFQVAAVAFSWLIATLPDSKVDVALREITWARVRVPLGLSSKQWQERGWRYAFAPTAYLFEGDVNYLTGRASTWLSRNLIVTDRSISAEGKQTDSSPKVSLRQRNLDYAVLARSDLRHVDFTGASLVGANLHGADLRGARFGCANVSLSPDIVGDLQRRMRGYIEVGAYPENERCARLDRVNLGQADLRGSQLRRSVLWNADMRGANLQGLDLSSTSLSHVDLTGAKLQGADLRGVEGLATRFASARMHGAVMRNATLMFSDFSGADVVAVDLSGADLSGAILQNVSLLGSDLAEATLWGADVRNAVIWATTPPNRDSLKLADLSHSRLADFDETRTRRLASALADIEPGALAEKIAALVESKVGASARSKWQTDEAYGAWAVYISGLSRVGSDYALRVRKYIEQTACGSPFYVLAAVRLYSYDPTNAWYFETYYPFVAPENDPALDSISPTASFKMKHDTEPDDQPLDPVVDLLGLRDAIASPLCEGAKEFPSEAREILQAQLTEAHEMRAKQARRRDKNVIDTESAGQK